MAIENKVMCCAILIKGNQILLAENKKGSRLNYSFLSTQYKKGTEEECIENYLVSKLNIEAKVIKKVYEYEGHDNLDSYFLLNWTGGVLSKKPEEISDGERSFTPILINMSKLNDTLVMPEEIKEQLILDYEKYGKNLNEKLQTVYEQ